MLRTHYELLAVAADADAAVIKRAYLKLSRTLHPDMPNGSIALFGMVTEAYEVLRDPKKRASYDQSLARGMRASSAGAPSSPRSSSGGAQSTSRQSSTGAAQPDPSRARQQATPNDRFAERKRAHRSRPPDDVPRSPTGRVPQWVIDEAQGRAPLYVAPWRGGRSSAHPVQHPRRRSRRWSTGLTSSLVVLALVGAAAWLQASGFVKPRVGSALTSRPANWPTPGLEEFAHPLGVPTPLVAPSGSYRYMAHQPDGRSPVAYDPCRPIHYVIRAQGEPAGGSRIIVGAILRVSRATGLRFVYDGATSEAPSRQRSPYQPGRYGDRWAPVLISWVAPREDPDFAADLLGEGGSSSVRLSGNPSAYVTGGVELDAAQITSVLRRPGGSQVVRAVVLHELGHLVGLGHVTTASQLMYPQVLPGVTDFGAGDLTGLAALGGGTCRPEL